MTDRPQHPGAPEERAERLAPSVEDYDAVYEGWRNRVADLNATVERLERERDEARAERDELRAIFDAQWQAEMRGIAAWRAENPEERDLAMPSTERFTVWLLNERDRARPVVECARRLAEADQSAAEKADAHLSAALGAAQDAAEARRAVIAAVRAYDVGGAALAGTAAPRPAERLNANPAMNEPARITFDPSRGYPPLCEVCGERWPGRKVGDLCPSCQLTAPVMWGVDDRPDGGTAAPRPQEGVRLGDFGEAVNRGKLDPYKYPQPYDPRTNVAPRPQEETDGR